MTSFLWLFAQAPQAAPTGSFLFQLMPIFLILFFFYFLLIRPQKKREEEHRRLLDSLQRGQRVITSSGIHGTVAALQRDTVDIEIAPKVKITIQRSSIAGVLSASSPVPAPTDTPEVADDSSSESAPSFKKKKK